MYAFQSGAATAILFMFGPEHLGGNGDLMKKLEAVSHLPEEEKKKEAEKVC